ncbi:hypothetical protein KJE01_23075 [Escherichia marmotae]|uniref:hypothetical protein n=1 Tax=Escherichia TaxID=561 RepID=UPI0007A00988|nr:MULTISPECIES: hypothetical protein [Escherichia]EFA4128323.1 hypothetical protein [Escherichia coli O13]EFZ2271159.1 hypothetical protein [Shigella sonnei]EES1815111.1 hypothetical protein [Escherichia coli]EES9562695.1 hypothetical protein [Escherichia coli]EEU1621175.1 hypothetical protein [Escherichia coli]
MRDDVMQARAAQILADVLASGIPPVEESRRKREHWASELAHKELLVRQRKIIPYAEWIDATCKSYAAFKDRMMAIPAEHAPRLYNIAQSGDRKAFSAALAGLTEEALSNIDTPERIREAITQDKRQ